MNFPFINVVTSTTSNSNIRQTGSDTFDTARKKKKKCNVRTEHPKNPVRPRIRGQEPPPTHAFKLVAFW